MVNNKISTVVKYDNYEVYILQMGEHCNAVIHGTGEPFARLSVTIDQLPPEGCFWLKAWSENEPFVKALLDGGHLELVGPKVMVTQWVHTQAARLIAGER